MRSFGRRSIRRQRPDHWSMRRRSWTRVSEPSFDLAVRPKRILCLDIENAPRWYGPGDYTYPIVFVVGYKWIGEPDKSVVSILIDPRSDQETKQQLTAPLWGALTEADSFLGHN